MAKLSTVVGRYPTRLVLAVMLMILPYVWAASPPTDVNFRVETLSPEHFSAVDVDDPIVQDIMNKFLVEYQEEVARTSLNVSVLMILKAEKTPMRQEVVEDLKRDRNDAFRRQRTTTQQYRIFSLVQYTFGSAMLKEERPYVSVLRLTMDCFKEPTRSRKTNFSCDVVEHLDLPRDELKVDDVDEDIRTAILQAAPIEFGLEHKIYVHFDAVEIQDLEFDSNPELRGSFVVKYVQYRVKNATNADDCMVVLGDSDTMKSVLFSDNSCYDPSLATDEEASYQVSKQNIPMILLAVSLVGCFVSLIVLVRHRRQRKGYSYLRSSSSKVSRVSRTKDDSSTDATPAAAT